MRRVSYSQLNNGLASALRIACIVVLLLSAVGLVLAGDLTSDQRDKLRALAGDTRTKVEAQREELRKGRMDLLSTYRAYKLDEQKAQSAMKRIGAAQLNLLNVLLDNQIKIRQILTADQFAKFQEMMSNRVHGFGFGMELSPPMEDEAIEACLTSRLKNATGAAADRVRRTGAKRWEMIGNLRTSSSQLADLYSKYSLDESSARKLIGSIHHNQAGLAFMAHRRQQAIRSWLNQSDFEQLQQDIGKKLQEGGYGRREHRSRQ